MADQAVQHPLEIQTDPVAEPSPLRATWRALAESAVIDSRIAGRRLLKGTIIGAGVLAYVAVLTRGFRIHL